MDSFKLDLITVIAIVEFLLIGVGVSVFTFIYKNLKSQKNEADAEFKQLEIDFDKKTDQLSTIIDGKVEKVTTSMENGIKSITEQMGIMIERFNSLQLTIQSHNSDITTVKQNVTILFDKLKESRLEVANKLSELHAKLELQDDKHTNKLQECFKELNEKINKISIEHARNHR